MKKRNRWLAAALAAAMVFTSVPSVAQAAADAQETGMQEMEAADQEEAQAQLLARYPLQENADDISGSGENGQTHGSITWEDGMVLPGGKGTSAQDASYVTLPGSLFEGQEELTISVWIKSNTNPGNYAALFFGTPAQSNKMPLNYWLFNPGNPRGLFKSVFTDSNNSGAPYNSEVGVTQGSTSGYQGVWTHYTTVLTEDSITGYINGVKQASASKTRKIADFGTGLEAYIGRSNYLDDKTYGGAFQDLQIYSGAMTDGQVEELYLDMEHVNQNVQEAILPGIAGKLSLDDQIENGVVMSAGKLNLVSQFMNTEVSWESDQPSVISGEGQITIPEKETLVHLTATLSVGEAVFQKTFNITVLSQGGSLEYAKERLQIPYVLDSGAALPNRIGEVEISWRGDTCVASDGTIQADFEGKREISLEAVLKDGENTETKQFSGYLLGSDSVCVQSYTRTASGDYNHNIADCMFLAFRENSQEEFTALNDDSGLLYMRAKSNEDETLTRKGLADPYLFYTREGDYGVAAVRVEEDGNPDGEAASSVMLYTSENLMQYEEVGLVDLNTDKQVSNPVCEYDSVADLYRITWNDENGNYYQNTLADLTEDSQASQPTEALKPDIRSEDTGLSGALEGNLLPLENEKGMKLKEKLSKLVNTGVEVPESVEAKSVEDVEAVRATALYNDGSTASKAVDWDLDGVDFEAPGTYTVEGTVTQPSFPEDTYLFKARPDPVMVKYNGKFYFISTDENGQGRIFIRESSTLEGIKRSSETLLLDGSTYPDLFKACLWAPELHEIQGDLYLFFAGSKTNWSGVQSYVAKLKEGGNPMKTSDWEKPVRVQDQEGNNLYDETTQGITLDMTYFEVEGQGYVVWAQRQLKPVDTGSWLYIATVDADRPWQLTSDRICISKPDYGWDNNHTFVDEGPFLIQRDGMLYMTFSGAATDNTYCIGMLTAKADANLLDAASWTKGNYPILDSFSVPGQYGPGHNSYVYDDDGTLYNVYHAKWNGGTRSASIRRVHFDIDGEPVLDVVESRDLLEEYRHVTMEVKVLEGGHNPEPAATVLADFTFDNETDGFIGGTAKASGSYTLENSYDGKALYLDGSASNYLTVTNQEGGSLLTGLNEVTISYEMKPDRTTTNWVMYAAPDSHQQEYGKESYLGILENGGTTTAERYLNSGSRPANPSAKTGSDWHHVDVVVTKKETILYVNGTEQSRVESTKSLSDIFGETGILQIGKANWGSNGEYFKGWIDNFKIYGKACSKEELPEFSEGFAKLLLEQTAASISDLTLDTATKKLPDYSGRVTWKSNMPEIVIGEDGLTAAITQAEIGGEAVTGTLTAILSLGKFHIEKSVKVTINPKVSADTPYGYLMVHFIENSAGYSEKIYLDISRGDNPEQWDPLNEGEPILASNLGKTGVRDPYLTYNPETKTYYIIATDLRVFGGDEAGWGVWQKSYSTKMNVWESEDLITWSDVRQFDVALNAAGEKQAELGMMWAPEATWVPDYYGEGKGAFVVYWSSKLYPDSDPNHDTQVDSKIMWGATTDFTQETYEYGGVFLSNNGRGYIDTTMIQNGNKTYHITKDVGSDSIIMQSTEDKEWWKPETKWTTIQRDIGKSRFGSVEGPAVFQNHSKDNSWYLFVDDLPQPGYQPMATDDLDSGWDYLSSPDYFLTTNTKHGGVISLTRGQYDAIRAADAVSTVSEDLGMVTVKEGQTEEEVRKQLPLAEVNTTYDTGRTKLPVSWDLSGINLKKAGTYTVTGIVQSIGANKNHWVGKDGSTAYDAPDRKLYSSRELAVSVTVKVEAAQIPDEKPDKPVTPPTDEKPTPDPVPQEQVGQVQDLKAKAAATSVKLTWKKVSGAAGYRIYRYDKAKKAYVKIRETTKTSYTDKGRKSATAYSYRVCAFRVNGKETVTGAYSEVKKTLTKPTVPKKVSAKRTSRISKKSTAVLSFRKVARASAYRIDRYNPKTKKYVSAYQIKGKKLYQYNSKTRKYKKIGKVKIKKNTITCTLKKLNLKKGKKLKFRVRAVASKSGYSPQTGRYSKAVTIK